MNNTIINPDYTLVNYRSAFSLQEFLFDRDGNKIAPTDIDWSITYFVENATPRTFTASCKDGVLTNCHVDNDTLAIIVTFPSTHGLPEGVLAKVVRYTIANPLFPNDEQELCDAYSTTVKLWAGATMGMPISSNIVLNYAVGPQGVSAYDIAVSAGYTGTPEEFANALSEVGNFPIFLSINPTYLALKVKHYGKELFDKVIAIKNDNKTCVPYLSFISSPMRAVNLRYDVDSNTVKVVITDLPSTEDGKQYKDRLLFYNIAEDGTITRIDYNSTIGEEVKYSAQELTEEQQAQARSNIGVKDSTQGVYPTLLAGGYYGEPFLAGGAQTLNENNLIPYTLNGIRVDGIRAQGDFATTGPAKISQINVLPLYPTEFTIQNATNAALSRPVMGVAYMWCYYEESTGKIKVAEDIVGGYAEIKGSHLSMHIMSSGIGILLIVGSNTQQVTFSSPSASFRARSFYVAASENYFVDETTVGDSDNFIDCTGANAIFIEPYATDFMVNVGVIPRDYPEALGIYATANNMRSYTIDLGAEFPYGLVSHGGLSDVWSPERSIRWFDVKEYEAGDENNGYIVHNGLSAKALSTPIVTQYNRRLPLIPCTTFDSAFNFDANVAVDYTPNWADRAYLISCFVWDGENALIYFPALYGLFDGTIRYVYDEGFSGGFPITLEEYNVRISFVYAGELYTCTKVGVNIETTTQNIVTE